VEARGRRGRNGWFRLVEGETKKRIAGLLPSFHADGRLQKVRRAMYVDGMKKKE